MTSDNRMNGGQVIIDYLIREKVPYVFGLCGHGNIGIIDAIEAANLKPIIDREFPLSEIAEAFRHQESGKHFGKICLTF